MAGTLTPTPFQTVLDTDGVAVSGALIYTYVGGTTTAAATYTTSALSVANANPIVADAAGRFVAYLPAGGNFKFLYKTAAGATIEEQDNILSVPGAAVNLDIEGTVGQAVTAGQVCYLSTGAEATPLTAGLWYLTDADFAPTSTTCQSVGVAVSAIAINTAGTIRLAGTATMATAVVIGSTYYVSATAGAITATAPALSRTVGVALTTSTLLLAAVTAVVTPAGSNTQVQFNDSGVLGGDAGFTYIKATDAVAIAGPTTVGGTLGVTGATTLSSTVATGALTVTGAATVSTTLGVTGATTLSSTVATGALTVTGAATVSTTLGVTGAITSATSVALTGTTNNLGTITSGVWNAGAVTSSGGISGTTGAFSSTVTGGTYNGQTISSAANFTGTLGVAGLLTVSGSGLNEFIGTGSGGEQTVRVRNSAAGTTNRAIFMLGNDTNATGARIEFQASNLTPTGVRSAAQLTIQAEEVGGVAIAATNASGAIRFYSGGTTEAGRWDTSRNLLIAKTSADTGVVGIEARAIGFLVATRSGGNPLHLNRTTNDGSLATFRRDDVEVGSISIAGSTTSYNTTSDARLKMNPVFVTDLAGLRGTAVYDFDWRAGGKGRGVFAQEAYAVMPQAVSVGGDDPKTNPWSVDYSKYVPDLIVGWQQHDATISQLAARIAALETKDN